MKNIWLGILLALVAMSPAQAQNVFAKVVSSCGSPSPTPQVGTPYQLTIDTNGNLCGNLGGGGTATVTGNVGGFDAVISNSPAVTNSSYVANNAIGGLQTVAAFRNATQPSGILTYVEVASKGGYGTAITIYGYTRTPSATCTDHSAFAFSSTDLPFLIPGFPIVLTPAALNATTQTIASQAVIVSVKNNDSGALTANLYFCAVANGTTTPASTSDLTFIYAFVQD